MYLICPVIRFTNSIESKDFVRTSSQGRREQNGTGPELLDHPMDLMNRNSVRSAVVIATRLAKSKVPQGNFWPRTGETTSGPVHAQGRSISAKPEQQSNFWLLPAARLGRGDVIFKGWVWQYYPN